jgi:uncharacterized protein (DUF2235 family)
MGKNLVICCDGTNNEFGPNNTNIVRLVQALHRHPGEQTLFYDPGVGTLPEPGAIGALAKKISEIPGLAFGAGLTDKVQMAYTYLMDYWEPGDRVFLFGFSRGAYTVRVLAGMLHSVGLLARGGYNLVPYATRLYKSIRGAKESSRYFDLCAKFRWTFARPVPGDDEDERHFPIDFMGLWDTVSSVGWVWDPPKFPYTTCNPSVKVIRHAVSIDERRWFFRQNLVAREAKGQDIKEYWFPGVHSDVGGGYEEEDPIWRCSFDWILSEATTCGLQINATRLAAVLKSTADKGEPWRGATHESLRGLWWLAEFFPKLRRRPGSPTLVPAFGLGRRRRIHPGAKIHQSALSRLRASELKYDPSNLSEKFRHQVRALPDPPALPETLPTP